MSKDNNDEDWFGEVIETTTRHTIRYLPKYIEEDDRWYKLCHELRSASEDDRFTLILGCRGGDVETGLEVIHAMKESKAMVMTQVNGPCYSMGAILAISGSLMAFKCKEPYLMFHNNSGTEAGKGKERFDSMIQFDQLWRMAMKEYCTPFLTDEEISFILNDNDIYVKINNRRELIKRCKRHFPDYAEVYKVKRK